MISAVSVNDPFLLLYDFKHLAEKLEIFLEYGVDPANILRDTRIFHSSTHAILARLTPVKEANITRAMPWMIRCVETAFEKYVFQFEFLSQQNYNNNNNNNNNYNNCNRRAIQIRVDAKEALGEHANFESFLSECLDIEKQVASEMVKRHPRLSKRSVPMVRKLNVFRYHCIQFHHEYSPGEKNSRVFAKRDRLHQKRYCVHTIGPLLWFRDNSEPRRRTEKGGSTISKSIAIRTRTQSFQKINQQIKNGTGHS